MTPKILVVDDSSDIHALVRVRLAREQVQIISAWDAGTGMSAARSQRPDLILLDVDLPDRDGFSVCADLKSDSETMEIPVIFLSGASSTEDKIRGLDLGAVDYVTKPFDPAELRARVRASLRTRQLMTLLSKKAMIDGLTGLWNRRYLDDQLRVELAGSRRSGEPLSCLMLDVDHFKSINDRYGHGFGDEVLRKVATVLTDLSRPHDIVCRYGGEEFAVLLPNTDAEAAVKCAERFRTAIADADFNCGDDIVRLTCSFGVSCSNNSQERVFEDADLALYEAKLAGRNCMVCRSERPSLRTVRDLEGEYGGSTLF